MRPIMGLILRVLGLTTVTWTVVYFLTPAASLDAFETLGVFLVWLVIEHVLQFLSRRFSKRTRA